jgi:ferric-dicitrate binding protein FerR (iron transport regulator)
MEADNLVEILLARVVSGNADEGEKEQLRELLAINQNEKLLKETERVWENTRQYLSAEAVGHAREQAKERLIADLSAKSRRFSFQRRFYWAAAVLAVAVMTGIGWQLGSSRRGEQEVARWCEVIAPKGQVSECVLPDGSRVWLNAGTSLSYTTEFGNENRNLQLSGEAFFKVVKNPRKPFVVSTKYLEVKVLGTSFNVKAYDNDGKIETSLEEGSVELRVPTGTKQPVILKPGERAVYNISKKDISVGKTDVGLISAWRTGKYVFRNAGMETLVHELERLYDVKIHFNSGSFTGHRFRGVFNCDEDILDALERLGKTTEFTYVIKGREVWIE